MTNSQEEKTPNRRSFLKLMGTAPVAAAATTLGAQTAAAEEADAQSGLQDTDHTRTYYALARF